MATPGSLQQQTLDSAKDTSTGAYGVEVSLVLHQGPYSNGFVRLQPSDETWDN